jgi:dolichol kinase
VEGLIEFLRLKNDYVRAWFIRTFGSLLREHEENHVSGVVWMTLGALCAALLVPPPLGATAMLYLIFGDGVASLVGKTAGGPHWPKSPKRVSGSLACFAVCLIIGFFMLQTGYGWPIVFFGALAATIAEFGIANINDNLTIPLVASLVFVALLKTIV